MTEAWLAAVITGTQDLIGTEEGFPVILSCAKAAYFQAKGFCRRDFILGTYTEFYPVIDRQIKLRHTPLMEILSVWVDEVELSPSDYTVLGASIQLRADSVVVKYKGGYPSAASEPSLLQALVLQTVAIYNKRQHLGFRSISGGPGADVSASITTFERDLIPEAKALLEPFVYYAPVTLLEVEYD